jgi:hypothetical protein
LMMKAEWLPMKRPDVTCCCWWRGSRQLLMMGKKGDRCRRAAVDEDWRGSPKPWAVEEIIVAVDEKEVATVSIDDWTWSEEREGVKTGPWPWPLLWRSSPPLLWLSVPGWLIREGD